MPQASDELREVIAAVFKTDGIDDGAILNFLFSRGYKEQGGLIYHPNSGHQLTEKEDLAIRFLIEEWDYGWTPHNTPTVEKSDVS